MVDLVAIQGAISSIKTAKDIAKTAIGLRDAALLQEKVIELNDAIISAQSSALDAQADQLTLAKRIENLERQIADMEEWKTEKQRYELHEFETGTLAYVLKEQERGTAPAHYVCTNCFNEGHASILQKETRIPYFVEFLDCKRCSAEIIIRGERRPEHGKAGRPRR